MLKTTLSYSFYSLFSQPKKVVRFFWFFKKWWRSFARHLLFSSNQVSIFELKISDSQIP